MGGRLTRLSLIVLAMAVAPAALRAEVTVPDPGTFVVDRAGIIDSAVEARMEAWLRELQQKTTAQVKVLTVPTVDGEDLFGFAQRHAELWKLGRKGKDNGVLIVVAIAERKDRIHVGYGLESFMPDSWCGSVRREFFVPYFKMGNFSEGLYRGTVAVANKIADQANVALTGIPRHRVKGTAGRARRRGRPSGFLCGGGLMPMIVFFVIMSSMSRRRRHRGRWGGGGLLSGMMLGSMLGGMGRSHWGGGGGGGFGGGFGGGSFGGGGGFGGGGAGGGW